MPDWSPQRISFQLDQLKIIILQNALMFSNNEWDLDESFAKTIEYLKAKQLKVYSAEIVTFEMYELRIAL